jgi:integrase
MALEIRRKADGTLKSNWWYGAYMVNGRRRATNLGVEINGTLPKSLRNEGDKVFERSRGQAQEKLKRLIADANSHKSAEALVQNLHEIKYGTKILTFPINDLKSAWDRMPKKRRTLHPRYVTDVHATIKRFVEYIRHKHPELQEVAQVTRNVARGFMDAEEARQMAAKTWNDSLTRMRAIFKFLQVEYGVVRNPFDGIMAHEENHVHRKPFSMVEVQMLLDAVKHDEICRPLIVCGLSTAMRRGDCCLLKWADVNMKGPLPSMTIKTSKTGETVCIPVYEHLMRELVLARKRWNGKSEYVWPEAALLQKHNPQGVSWRLKQAFKRAGFKDGDIHARRVQGMRKASVRDFHSLRTTWITEALSRGVPIETVKLISGHKTVEVVTTHYFRPGQDQVRAALEGAMPRLLTNGGQPDTVVGKTAKDQILGICKGMTVKSWKQDAKRIAKLVEGM